MKKFAYIFLLMAAATFALWVQEPTAQTKCAQNWTADEYKSFEAVQTEIKKQYGEVRILRVALCDQGGNAYFQVVIISGQGEVRRVQLAAASE